MNEITIDQKLKAFEIASRFLTLDGPDENSTQEEFDRYMDKSIACITGLATVILQKVVSMKV